MTLALDDHWVWDFWFAQDGNDVHVFYLHAPRSLGDPDLRHHRASIGHAVSTDLRSWEVLPQALGPGDPGDFDDLATWTGSVLRADGGWHMFYTGVSRAENGRVQRIGRASSADLRTWTKHGLVLTTDPRWYETLHEGVREEAWRDPWVWWDEPTGRYHMVLTARARHGALDGRGVIGHASSPDLSSWEAEPPVSEPGEFYHLEVPQLVHLGGRWHILFCAAPQDHSTARRSRARVRAEGGTHVLTAADRFGPYAVAREDFLVGDPRTSLYAGRLLAHRGEWHFFAWENVDDDGNFVGRLADPMPVHVDPDGHIRVEVSPKSR